jgi:phage-related minor tail protein
MNTALTPLMTMVAEFVAKVADWAAKNPTLTATLVALGVAFGILMAAAIALTPAILALTGANWAMVASMAALILPVLAVIAVIGAVIAIGVLLYKNWGTIRKKAATDFGQLITIIKGIWERIKTRFNQGVQDIKTAFGKITSFFKGINLKDIGAKIIGGLIKGMSNMYEKVKTKAREIANTVKEAIKDKLSITSPSKVTEELGMETGAGFVKGLESQIKVAQETASKLAKSMTTSINAPKTNELGKYKDVITKYFQAIREDGDWLNDWASSIPKQFQKNLLAMGQEMQNLEGGSIAQRNAAVQKALTVNLHSPKALDIREAQLVWNRTIQKLSLEW